MSEDALFAHETNEYSNLVSRWPVPAHGLVLQIEVELDGAVVGAEDLGVDLGGCDLVPEGVGDEEVVQPPTDVLLAGVESVRPPGIFHLVRVLEPPGVSETRVQKPGELAALLIGEPGVAAVRVRILDVYLIVGHVHVTADHHTLPCGEAGKIFPEIILPPHPVVEPPETVLRVRHIDADKEELRHLQRDDAPLMVVFLNPDAVRHRERRVP